MDAITFGTDGWRATLEEFTAPRVRAVGQAVADHLADEGRAGDPVVVGYDARPSSEGFAEELCRVLCANGHGALLPERDVPTPLVAHAVVERELAGGLMLTASHNPPEYNGVKFIPEDGAPALPAVTDAIEAAALSLVDAELDGVVAYDAMHGSGRGVTDALLERAGADVRRLRCERDERFGGVDPEPSADHLPELIELVREGPARLGVANDGDADRIGVVTPERGYLNANLLFAALYDYLLERDSGPAIRTVSTTFLIDRVAEAHGERVHETPVGFKWVAEAMADHDALIGGEESGGFTVRGHVREKDGVLLALLAAAADAEEPLDDRVDRLLDEHGAVVQDKVSVDCPDERKAAAVAALEERIPERVAGTAVEEVVTDDGFKLLLTDGSWLLVRPSGTEPKLRVYAEAESDQRVAELLAEGRELVADVV